ncbi:hypothetical protein EDD36DRAFT_421827 [Exophiala viscosa]|uniref:FAD-binding domain-containing protein n=1 Tax=Exophiala viscosa TaxID=2486360 RepID=A0AAN6DNS9_9EURO|nr:hypothetical protein EDD36DRAFT_421827 [Exophiala viscosa]
MATNFKVLIVGAGVTGLSLAHGLRKQGIEYEIFEKHGGATRHRDWGITVHWAVQFMELYPEDMGQRLRKAQVIVQRDNKVQEQVEFHNGETGEVFKHIPLGPAKRYSQKKIRQALTQEIPVQYNKEMKTIKELPNGVEVVFADGTTATGALVVCCDGAQSPSRQLLFANKEDAKWKPLPGFILNNFWMQYPVDRALKIKEGLSAFMDIAVHPNGTYYGLIPLDIDDPDKPESWKFQVFMAMKANIPPEEDSSERRFAIVKEAGKAFAEPFRSAIEWMPEGTFISTDRYGTWESIPWDNKNGRVLLAGDCAHSMTAHRAQGLNHALQDVLNLVHAIPEIAAGKLDLKEFADSYMAEVVERGADEVRMSLKQGLAVHNWGQNKDMPIVKIGTTPLHMEQTLVPLPTQGEAV